MTLCYTEQTFWAIAWSPIWTRQGRDLAGRLTVRGIRGRPCLLQTQRHGAAQL